MNARNLAGFAAIAGATAGAAIFGNRATGDTPRSSWYQNLEKPPFQPPPQVFGPVWTVLYGLIATSGYRVWSAKPSRMRTRALAWFGVQLVFNAAWSWFFFKKRSPRLALADIALLGAAIAAYVKTSAKVDRSAALLFVPYLGWVGFAALLNGEIVRRARA